MSTTLARSMADPNRPVLGVLTGMHAYEGEEWKVVADRYPGTEEVAGPSKDYATLRRIGWLDQKGRVWTSTPDSRDFDGGSLTPLLIDARD